MKVLFLCKGNVGRSVFGEYLYNSLTDTKNAYSAGTQLSGPGESLQNLLPKTQFVVDSMKEEGIDVGKHVRRNVTEDMVKAADLLVDMAEPETVPDFVKTHPKRVMWTIDNPKGTPLSEHVRIKNEIKEKVENLVNGE